MIPEVRELLLISREEYVKSMMVKVNNNTTEDGLDDEQCDEMYIGFEDFKKLIFSSMKKKGSGIGKSYVHAPRKKPEVTVQLSLEEEHGLTFKPDLSLIPKHLTESRMAVDKD